MEMFLFKCLITLSVCYNVINAVKENSEGDLSTEASTRTPNSNARSKRQRRLGYYDYLHFLLDKHAHSADEHLAAHKPFGPYGPYDMHVYPYGLAYSPAETNRNFDEHAQQGVNIFPNFNQGPNIFTGFGQDPNLFNAYGMHQDMMAPSRPPVEVPGRRMTYSAGTQSSKPRCCRTRCRAITKPKLRYKSQERNRGTFDRNCTFPYRKAKKTETRKQLKVSKDSQIESHSAIHNSQQNSTHIVLLQLGANNCSCSRYIPNPSESTRIGSTSPSSGSNTPTTIPASSQAATGSAKSDSTGTFSSAALSANSHSAAESSESESAKTLGSASLLASSHTATGSSESKSTKTFGSTSQLTNSHTVTASSQSDSTKTSASVFESSHAATGSSKSDSTKIFGSTSVLESSHTASGSSESNSTKTFGSTKLLTSSHAATGSSKSNSTGNFNAISLPVRSHAVTESSESDSNEALGSASIPINTHAVAPSSEADSTATLGSVLEVDIQESRVPGSDAMTNNSSISTTVADPVRASGNSSIFTPAPGSVPRSASTMKNNSVASDDLDLATRSTQETNSKSTSVLDSDSSSNFDLSSTSGSDLTSTADASSSTTSHVVSTATNFASTTMKSPGVADTVGSVTGTVTGSTSAPSSTLISKSSPASTPSTTSGSMFSPAATHSPRSTSTSASPSTPSTRMASKLSTASTTSPISISTSFPVTTPNISSASTSFPDSTLSPSTISIANSDSSLVPDFILTTNSKSLSTSSPDTAFSPTTISVASSDSSSVPDSISTTKFRSAATSSPSVTLSPKILSAASSNPSAAPDTISTSISRSASTASLDLTVSRSTTVSAVSSDPFSVPDSISSTNFKSAFTSSAESTVSPTTVSVASSEPSSVPDSTSTTDSKSATTSSSDSTVGPTSVSVAISDTSSVPDSTSTINSRPASTALPDSTLSPRTFSDAISDPVSVPNSIATANSRSTSTSPTMVLDASSDRDQDSKPNLNVPTTHTPNPASTFSNAPSGVSPSVPTIVASFKTDSDSFTSLASDTASRSASTSTFDSSHSGSSVSKHVSTAASEFKSHSNSKFSSQSNSSVKSHNSQHTRAFGTVTAPPSISPHAVARKVLSDDDFEPIPNPMDDASNTFVLSTAQETKNAANQLNIESGKIDLMTFLENLERIDNISHSLKDSPRNSTKKSSTQTKTSSLIRTRNDSNISNAETHSMFSKDWQNITSNHRNRVEQKLHTISDDSEESQFMEKHGDHIVPAISGTSMDLNVTKSNDLHHINHTIIKSVITADDLTDNDSSEPLDKIYFDDISEAEILRENNPATASFKEAHTGDGGSSITFSEIVSSPEVPHDESTEDVSNIFHKANGKLKSLQFGSGSARSITETEENNQDTLELETGNSKDRLNDMTGIGSRFVKILRSPNERSSFYSSEATFAEPLVPGVYTAKRNEFKYKSRLPPSIYWHRIEAKSRVATNRHLKELRPFESADFEDVHVSRDCLDSDELDAESHSAEVKPRYPDLFDFNTHLT